MSPLELVFFGAACYLFGLVSGPVVTPGEARDCSGRAIGSSRCCRDACGCPTPGRCVDKDFDLIADVTGQAVERLVTA
jgi:hypothetical protein